MYVHVCMCVCAQLRFQLSLHPLSHPVDCLQASSTHQCSAVFVLLELQLRLRQPSDVVEGPAPFAMSP